MVKNMIDYLLFGVYFFTVVFFMRVVYRWVFSGRAERFKSDFVKMFKKSKDKID